MNRKHSPLALALLAAVLAAGCGMPEFDDPMNVQGLRVLAVRADPPEVAAPGDPSAPARADLASLVAHPAFAADAARRVTVVHLACTPSPGATSSPCTVISQLSDPTVLFAYADLALACTAPGVGEVDAITLAGVEACGAAGCEQVSLRRDPDDAGSLFALPAPGYEVPAEASLASLPGGHPDRVLGAEIVDLVLALDVEPEALAPATAAATDCEALAAVAGNFVARWQAQGGVTALKRLRLRGPDALSGPNQNPVLSGITLAGAALPAPGAAPATVAAGAKHDLLPLLPGDEQALLETYVEADADGRPVREKREEWTYAWFTTAGELKDAYTRTAADAEQLTAPGAGPFLVWVVVRDLRGGIEWRAASLAAGG